jgi:hypothetical protein
LSFYFDFSSELLAVGILLLAFSYNLCYFISEFLIPYLFGRCQELRTLTSHESIRLPQSINRIAPLSAAETKLA